MKKYKCIKSYSGSEVGIVYTEQDIPNWFRNKRSTSNFIKNSSEWNKWFEEVKPTELTSLPERWCIKNDYQEVRDYLADKYNKKHYKNFTKTDWIYLCENKERKECNATNYIEALEYSNVVEITFEQFQKWVLPKEEVKEESLVGRYIKALVDRPLGGYIKAGEYGIITDDKRGYVDFPSQRNYGIEISFQDYPNKYQLMPKDFNPNKIESTPITTTSEDLLKEAKRRYPVGTVYKGLVSGTSTIKTETFDYYKGQDQICTDGGTVYLGGQWAKIISKPNDKYAPDGVTMYYTSNNDDSKVFPEFWDESSVIRPIREIDSSKLPKIVNIDTPIRSNREKETERKILVK